MRWVQKIVTSLVVTGVTAVGTYLLANLLLAFSQETIRVYLLFKETNTVETLTEFRQSIGTALIYQPDYQLYYISIWILVGVGLFSGIIKIFTEMYKPKSEYRRRVEENRQEGKSEKVNANDPEFMRERLRSSRVINEKPVEPVSFEPKGESSVIETTREVGNQEDELQRDEIINGILKEVQGRKLKSREQDAQEKVEDEEDFGEFELVRSSPDTSFNGIVNGKDKDEGESEYQDEELVNAGEERNSRVLF